MTKALYRYFGIWASLIFRLEDSLKRLKWDTFCNSLHFFGILQQSNNFLGNLL